MTVHGNQRASQGVVVRCHPIDGLAGDASRIDVGLLTNIDRCYVTDTGQINVQARPVHRRIDCRLDVIEEARQS